VRVDDISPAYLGEDLITVSLADKDAVPTSGQIVRIAISYDRVAAKGGVVLPIEVTVIGPDDYERRVFRIRPPTAYAFIPSTPGDFLVLVKETAHNKWVGRLTLSVGGDELENASRPGRR
jgi:hypothetical protein